MNHEEHWKSLIALSAPTFAGEIEPPYGFVTSMLARLQAEKRQDEIMTRLGLRAIFASLAVLAVSAGVAFGVHKHNRLDFDPGTGSMVQVENVPLM
jgi:hypothetical protein